MAPTLVVEEWSGGKTQTSLPVIPKLSPNVTDIVAIAGLLNAAVLMPCP